MLKTVYVVTQGTYSDYRIEAIYSNKSQADLHVERAKKYDDSWSTEDITIEEWKLDTPIPDKCLRTYITKAGEVTGIYDDFGNEGFCCFKVNHDLAWYVKTDNKERAIKVINEKRIQILAMNLWDKEEECKELFGVSNVKE